ncbi:sialic acid-binding Ig-like lectin 10 isoform X2 [Fukomys damarensis]|uniref:sialic acid-binding Ig-like lectin 10 isoform X2 n=1 Tax=Fukomys damarensis TaxID=885580 RepID=UPI00053F31BA|nr:sialic acid-binding Ig-like lectin 10 isoform X2 [Fukomys damarensis]
MLLLLSLLSLPLRGSWAQQPGYWLQVERQVTVQEGLCILVPCSFSYPSDGWDSDPVYGYWFKEGAEVEKGSPVATNNPNRNVWWHTQDRFQLVGKPLEKNCALLIRAAWWSDGGTYFFRVETGKKVKYSFKTERLTLEVTDLTQRPDIFVPDTLEPGQPVTVLCVFNWSSKQCPVPAISWAAPALDSKETRPADAPYIMLSLTPRPQDQDAELTCRVDFSRSSRSSERTVRLRVAYPPKHLVVSISHDSGPAPDTQGNGSRVEAQKGQLLRLLCAADSRPPATLTWDLEGRVLARSPPSGPRTLELELPRVRPGDAGRYTCRAENRLGSQHSSLELSVQYPPEDLRVTVSQANRTVLEILGNGTSLPMMEGQSLRLVCATHSSPPAKLSWAWGTQPLSLSWSSAPGVLELPRVQMEHEGEVTCHAENPLGTRSVSLSLSVHYRTPISAALSKGVFVGIGGTALLSLGLVLILVKALRTSRAQAEALRPKLSRRSTILDYINVIPKARPLARNQKAKPSSPSQIPSPETRTPVPKKNQKEQHWVSLGCPEPKTFTGKADSEISPEGLHYATLNFPGPRPRESQQPTDTHEDYAEIQFYPGPRRP